MNKNVFLFNLSNELRTYRKFVGFTKAFYLEIISKTNNWLGLNSIHYLITISPTPIFFEFVGI